MTDEKKYWVHPWEADAPERIWVWGWRADSVWQEQTWQHEDEPMSTMEYVRADLFAALTEQLAAARRDAEEAEAYAAELEAKLAKAVKGLEDIADGMGEVSRTEIERFAPAVARTTLAELTRGNT